MNIKLDFLYGSILGLVKSLVQRFNYLMLNTHGFCFLTQICFSL